MGRMGKTGRITALVLLAVLLAGLSSCGGTRVVRELDELKLVRVLAVDPGDDGNIRVSAFASSISEEEPTVLSGQAKTMGAALADMQTLSDKYMFLGHVDNFLLGETAARNGLGNFDDWLTRDISLRLGVRCLLIVGTEAETVMEKFDRKLGLEQFLQELERAIKLMSETNVFTLGEAAASLSENGAALVAALEFREDPNVISGGSELTLIPTGYGVFTEAGLTDLIDPDEALGVSILIGEFAESHVEVPDGQGGVVGLDVNRAGVKYTPQWSGGELTGLGIECTAEAAVEEMGGSLDLFDEGVLEELERALAVELARRMDAAVAREKTLGADFLGLAHRIDMADPMEFEKIRGSWTEILPQLKVTVTVKAEVERSFDMTQPLGSDTAGLGDVLK